MLSCTLLVGSDPSSADLSQVLESLLFLASNRLELPISESAEVPLTVTAGIPVLTALPLSWQHILPSLKKKKLSFKLYKSQITIPPQVF